MHRTRDCRAAVIVTHERTATAMLLAAAFAVALLASSARAETPARAAASPPAPAATATGGKPAPTAKAPGRKKSPYKTENLTFGARKYYAATLGVDALKVRRTNAGNLIRFSYRVVDPGKAKAMGDRQTAPYLIGHTSHAMLQVPVMDKVGPLRQAARPEAGKEYWMVFSNKGDVVKAGERVSVVVGKLRLDGLRVE